MQLIERSDRLGSDLLLRRDLLLQREELDGSGDRAPVWGWDDLGDALEHYQASGWAKT